MRAVKTGGSSLRSGWPQLNSCISSWKGSRFSGAMSMRKRRTREERYGELCFFSGVNVSGLLFHLFVWMDGRVRRCI